jgi:hypothetical protein
MVKKYGFYASRRREPSRRLLLPRWAWALALAALLWILGATRAQPQNSGWSLNSSGGDLKTWETLSGQFQTALNGQSERLRQALKELEASKANTLNLTSLLEQSLKANDSLKSYNAELAERMQDRDESLAAAYEELDGLEKKVLKHWIAHIVTGAALLGCGALVFTKFFIFKFK